MKKMPIIKSSPVLGLVIDLRSWKSALRFNLDADIENNIDIYQGVLYGIMKRKEEPFARAFTVNLKTAEMYTVPLRRNPLSFVHVFPLVLPDGRFFTEEGFFSIRCSYEGPVPDYFFFSPTSKGLYARDWCALHKIDPSTGGEKWHIRLGYNDCVDFWTIDNGECMIHAERGILYAADARTGQLHFALRTQNVNSPLYDLDPFTRINYFHFMNKTCIACDNERVYYSSPASLKVYSLEPVDPDKPDPYDPGDPAFTLRKTREAMQKGEYQNAVKLLSGIAVQAQLRPSVRAEAACLFSQLSRSPIPRRYPKQWEHLIASDGWIAGDLFLKRYKEISAKNSGMTALYLCGKKGIQSAAEGLDVNKGAAYPFRIAAEAQELLTGTYPYEKMFECNAREFMEMTIPDAVFKKLLPRLKTQRDLKCRLGHIPPRQVLAVIPEDSENEALQRIREAARRQLESQKNKEGERMDIEIWGKKQ